MNIVLWIVQVLLALAFFVSGFGHSVSFERLKERKRGTWLTAVGRPDMNVSGALEMLGAAGLVLPAATGIVPWLTPLAALCCAVLLVLAILFHLVRSEYPNIGLNAALGLLAVFVA